ncbi:hypothetical protein P1J78_25225, partial [Psychromarinibacter sp. C21-152]
LCGQAITPAGVFNRADGESEGAFLVRAFAANAPAGEPQDLTDDDLEQFLAGRDEEIAIARAHKEPITEAMLKRAMMETAR